MRSGPGVKVMRDHWLGDFLLLTALLGLFFCFGLGGRALWAPDEGRYSEVAHFSSRWMSDIFATVHLNS